MSFLPKAFRPEWRNLLIMMIMLAMTGCKYPFELDYKDVEPMTAIRSYICADSLVTVDVHKTIPLAKLAVSDSTLINPHYSIKCNGTEVDAEASMLGASRMVLSSGAFKSGDKLEIVFKSDDTETAVASTVIPDSFPEYELKLGKNENAERNLKIIYKDNPDAADYYGAIVKWKGIQGVYVGYDEIQYTEVTDMDIIPPSGYNDLQLEPEAYSPILLSFNGDYLYIWKDLDEEDNEYDLSFNYRLQWDGYITEVKDAEIQCSLFKLSEEMYRHLFAEFDSNSNPFVEAGFSSPAFTYSNVRNGLGYFCGYSVVQSEWIKDTLFEEE